jgi:flagellar basal-body rod protein FlgC
VTNLANSETTRTLEGGPYRRKNIAFQTTTFGDAFDAANGTAGVEVSSIEEDITKPFERRYQPGHPDADADGYVLFPNVSALEEMANLISAARGYEANIASISIVKSMIAKTLEIGR